MSARLPMRRSRDGSLLFLLHLNSKMRPAKDGGSLFGIVLNGSPLFTGGAGSGESKIRRYVLENDLVEAIIGLPTDMFYDTGMSNYVWIDETKTRTGYEIPFTRHSYVSKPPRPLEEIDADLKGCTDRILAMIEGLSL